VSGGRIVSPMCFAGREVSVRTRLTDRRCRKPRQGGEALIEAVAEGASSLPTAPSMRIAPRAAIEAPAALPNIPPKANRRHKSFRPLPPRSPRHRAHVLPAQGLQASRNQIRPPRPTPPRCSPRPKVDRMSPPSPRSGRESGPWANHREWSIKLRIPSVTPAGLRVSARLSRGEGYWPISAERFGMMRPFTGRANPSSVISGRSSAEPRRQPASSRPARDVTRSTAQRHEPVASIRR